MRLLVVLAEMLVKPSFVMRFRDLIAANAKASVQREVGCQRFDVLCDPAATRRFVLYEIHEDEEAFAAHLASSYYLSGAASNDNQIDQRAIRRCFLQPDGGGRRLCRARPKLRPGTQLAATWE